MNGVNHDCDQYRSLMLGEAELGDLRLTVPLLDKHPQRCIPCASWKETDFREAPDKVLEDPWSKHLPAGRIAS